MRAPPRDTSLGVSSAVRSKRFPGVRRTYSLGCAPYGAHWEAAAAPEAAHSRLECLAVQKVPPCDMSRAPVKMTERAAGRKPQAAGEADGAQKHSPTTPEIGTTKISNNSYCVTSSSSSSKQLIDAEETNESCSSA